MLVGWLYSYLLQQQNRKQRINHVSNLLVCCTINQNKFKLSNYFLSHESDKLSLKNKYKMNASEIYVLKMKQDVILFNKCN